MLLRIGKRMSVGCDGEAMCDMIRVMIMSDGLQRA
jgi:hypothetical protein